MALDTTYRRLKLGAGGFVCHIDISPDGSTRLIKTDVFGAYVWANPSNRSARDTTGMNSAFEWCQLVTKTSMPSDENALATYLGHACYEIRCAPSNPDRLYAVFIKDGAGDCRFYRSDDQGQTWTRTSPGFTVTDMQTGSTGFDYRTQGPKLVVDPLDEDSVYIVSNDGDLRYSRDGGDNWTLVSTSEIPAGTPMAIVIDPSSSTVSGRKSRLYACSGTNGLYVSTDSGVNWAAVASSPAKYALSLRCDSLGRVWFVASDPGDSDNCYSYISGSWTHISTSNSGANFHSIAVNPLNTNEVVAQSYAGPTAYSGNGGSTWTIPGTGAMVRDTTDIPWLEQAFENSMSAGISEFDPLVDGLFWFPMGIGVYYCTAIPTTNDTLPEWTELSRGNDELICNALVKPPGGELVGTFWDRAVFKFPADKSYPTTHGPVLDVPIRHGWGLDYAKSDPTTLVVVTGLNGGSNKSGISTDGGATWTEFATAPATDFVSTGCIAASTPDKLVWIPGANGAPHYSADGGDTWAACTFPAAVPSGSSDERGWGFSLFTHRNCLAADHVTEGTFFAYNYGGWDNTGDQTAERAAAEGFYRSTDGGANWTRRGAGGGVTVGSSGVDNSLECVPGKTGHFFWTRGRAGTDGPYDPDETTKSFIFSDDGGTNAYRVDDFVEAWSVSFGKALGSHPYPTIFCAGWMLNDTEPGIYRCSDWNSSTRTGTWTRTADDYTTIDAIGPIAGDMDEYGTVYVGLKASGVVYGTLNQSGGRGGRIRLR